jgi:hypothetical protein
MRFIVALVLLVAVANAKIVKEGGLKGSWFDTIVLTSDDDVTAPDIDFTDTANVYWESWDGLYETTPYVGTNISGGWSDYGYFNFEFTSASDDDTGGGCDLVLTLGEAVDGVYENTIDCTGEESCYGSTWSCYSTCYARYYIKGGVYDSWLTCWDQVGNWAMWGSDDIGTVTINNNQVDTMIPVLTDASASTDTVEIPEDSSRDDVWTFDISVTATDNEDTDDWASGVAGVWITVVDEDDNSMDLALPYDYYGSDDTVYGVTITVFNWAEPMTYTVTAFNAVDYAGNWAVALEDGWDVTISALAEDDVANCQTFDIGLTSLSTSDGTVDVTGSSSNYAWQYFRLGCTTKYGDATDNYAAVTFMGPAVTLVGDTMETMMMVADSASSLPPIDMVPSLLSDEQEAYYFYPAYYAFSDFLGDAYWTSYINFENGWPSGDWTLYEVWTFTETGSAQRYNADAGSASSVVPSLMVVAVAAVATLFHL